MRRERDKRGRWSRARDIQKKWGGGREKEEKEGKEGRRGGSGEGKGWGKGGGGYQNEQDQIDY